MNEQDRSIELQPIQNKEDNRDKKINVSGATHSFFDEKEGSNREIELRGLMEKAKEAPRSALTPSATPIITTTTTPEASNPFRLNVSLGSRPPLHLPEDDTQQQRELHQYLINVRTAELELGLMDDKVGNHLSEQVTSISAEIASLEKALQEAKNFQKDFNSRYKPVTEAEVRASLSTITSHPDKVTKFEPDMAASVGSAGTAINEVTGARGIQSLISPAVSGAIRNTLTLVERGYVPGNLPENADQLSSYIRSGDRDTKPKPGLMSRREKRNLELATKNITEKLDGFVRGTELEAIRAQYPEEFKLIVAEVIDRVFAGSSDDVVENALRSFLSLNNNKSEGFKVLNWLRENSKETLLSLGDFVKEECNAVRFGHGKTLVQLLQDQRVLLGETVDELKRAYPTHLELKAGSVAEAYHAFDDSDDVLDQGFMTLGVGASAILSELVAVIDLTARTGIAPDPHVFYFWVLVLKGKSDLKDDNGAQYQEANWFVKNVCKDSKAAAVIAGALGIASYLLAAWSFKQDVQVDLNLLKESLKLVGKLLELAAAAFALSGPRAKKAALEAVTTFPGLVLAAFIPNNIFDVRKLSDMVAKFKNPAEFSRLYDLFAGDRSKSATYDWVKGVSGPTTANYVYYLSSGVTAFLSQYVAGSFQRCFQKKRQEITGHFEKSWVETRAKLLSPLNVGREVKKRNAEIDIRKDRFAKAAGKTVEVANSTLGTHIKELEDKLKKLKAECSSLQLEAEKYRAENLDLIRELKEEKKAPAPPNSSMQTPPQDLPKAPDIKGKGDASHRNTEELAADIVSLVPGTEFETAKGLIALDKRIAEQKLTKRRASILQTEELTKLEKAGLNIAGLGFTSKLCYRQLISNEEAEKEKKEKNNKAITKIKQDIDGIKVALYQEYLEGVVDHLKPKEVSPTADISDPTLSSDKEAGSEKTTAPGFDIFGAVPELKDRSLVDDSENEQISPPTLTVAEKLTQVEIAQLTSLGWSLRDMSVLSQEAITTSLRPLLADLATRNPNSFSSSAQSSSTVSSPRSAPSMVSGSSTSDGLEKDLKYPKGQLTLLTDFEIAQLKSLGWKDTSIALAHKDPGIHAYLRHVAEKGVNIRGGTPANNPALDDGSAASLERTLVERKAPKEQKDEVSKAEIVTDVNSAELIKAFAAYRKDFKVAKGENLTPDQLIEGLQKDIADYKVICEAEAEGELAFDEFLTGNKESGKDFNELSKLIYIEYLKENFERMFVNANASPPKQFGANDYRYGDTLIDRYQGLIEGIKMQQPKKEDALGKDKAKQHAPSRTVGFSYSSPKPPESPVAQQTPQVELDSDDEREGLLPS